MNINFFFHALLISSLSIFFVGCENQSGKTAGLNTSDKFEKLIIQCNIKCDNTASDIKQLGGEITLTYKNVNAVAVNVPANTLNQIKNLKSIKSFVKDFIVKTPKPRQQVDIIQQGTEVKQLDNASLRNMTAKQPSDYFFNNLLTGAFKLHNQNITGKDVVVAVIDTGTANNPDVVPTLADNVIGGENFIDLPDEPSATSTANYPHGTEVGNMIAAHAALVAPNDSPLIQSLMVHSPESVFPDTTNATNSVVPLVGTAPEAKLYAMKVFPASGEGTPSSVVLQAMDRTLTLKRNFNSGMEVVPVAGTGTEDDPFEYNSLNIQVVNFSLGGATPFPGWEVDDILVLEMLKEGIAVVSAAGNEGFTAITGGSPGTSVGSLTVGAANVAAHERIFYDLTEGLGMGSLFRPSDTIQTAFFSSRGPTADGRTGLQLIAPGMGALVQRADGGLSLVSGTSFSSPTVAGAAALLLSAIPEATAIEISNALAKSANANILGDRSGAIDHGNGFLDIPMALTLLKKKEISDDLPKFPQLGNRPSLVAENIKEQDQEVIQFRHGKYSSKVELVPGQVIHFFVPSSQRTSRFEFKLEDINRDLSIEQQNALFGDNLLFTVIDATTSINDVLVGSVDEGFEVITNDTSFDVDNPQQGLVRVAIMGDWFNAGKVSARLTIQERRKPLGRPLIAGNIQEGDVNIIPLEIRAGTKQAVFDLSWKYNWGTYPSLDLDVVLQDPEGNLYFDGATWASPEHVTIDDPTPGVWNVVVIGYSLYGFEDVFQLRATDERGRLFKIVK